MRLNLRLVNLYLSIHAIKLN